MAGGKAFWNTGGAGGTLTQTGAYSEAVGDGATTTFVISHGLGTESVVVQGYNADALVALTTTITDVDTISVTFPAAPAASDGTVVVIAAGTPLGGGLFQTVHDLYGPNADDGILLQNTGGSYVWPGDALSASVLPFHFDQGAGSWSEIEYARWLLVWTPNGATNSVRLVHADAGPTNITQITEITGTSASTPTASGADITADLNALIAGGAWKQLGQQINTSGTSTRIYASRIEIVWRAGSSSPSGTASPLTTKGDVWGYSTTDARLPVGTDGQVLTADAAEALGVKWATPAAVASSRWEVVVTGNPAAPVTTAAGTDWLYTEV